MFLLTLEILTLEHKMHPVPGSVHEVRRYCSHCDIVTIAYTHRRSLTERMTHGAKVFFLRSGSNLVEARVKEHQH